MIWYVYATRIPTARKESVMIKCIGVALLCGSAVSAVIGAPEKIVVKPNGEFVVVDDGAGRGSNLRDVARLPVYSEGPDGQMLPGVYYSGTSKTGNHVWPMPVRLVVDLDGTYSIETAYWSMSHGPKGTLRHHLVPGSEFVQVRHDLDIEDHAELDGHGRGSGAVIWGAYQPGATSPVGEVPGEVAISIAHALSVWENLLELDPRVFQQFNFYWDDFANIPDPDERENARNSIIAFANTVHAFYSDVSTLFNYLNNDYTGQVGEYDSYEEDIYDFFPIGILKYEIELGTVESIASDVVFSFFHIDNIDGPASTNPPQAYIGMNPFKYSDFDFDPSDGIGEDQIDFRGSLIHEIGHHFGFLSTMDLRLNGQSPSEPRLEHPSMLDVFRFEDASAGVPNAFVFQTSGVRDLILNDASAAVLQLSDQDWFTPLSFGELIPGTTDSYFQPSHWRVNLIQPDKQIGIMAPTHPRGHDTRTHGSYFSPEDVRMFDLLGYRINYEDHVFNQQPVPAAPANDHLVDPGNSILFDWDVDSSVIRTDFMIYDLGPVAESHIVEVPNETMVYRNNDATTSTQLTLNSGEVSLVPGHRYQWHVATYHPLGVALSDPATFIVQDSSPTSKPCGPLNESAKLLGPGGGVASSEAGTSVAIDGDYIVVGAPSWNSGESNPGRVDVFKRDGSIWRISQAIYAPGSETSDNFGTCVALDGDLMVVGEPTFLENGSAHLYRLNSMSGEWELEQSLAPSDWFGYGVDVSGDKVVIGAPVKNSSDGAAYVYEKLGATWVEAYILGAVNSQGGSDNTSGDQFGYSVAIDQDVVVVGSPRHDDTTGLSVDRNTGAVYVYRQGVAGWDFEAKLFPDQLEEGDRLGYAVDVSGGAVVAGAPFTTLPDDDMSGYDVETGSAYVFEYGMMGWGDGIALSRESHIRYSGDNYGETVAIDGSRLVVGADFIAGFNNSGVSDSGLVLAYQRGISSGLWEESYQLATTDGDNGDYFGHDVAISGTTVVGGAWWDSNQSSFDGSSYVYELPECPADMNGDGMLNFFDVSAFLTAYKAMDPAADWNCDGLVDFFDQSIFLQYYNAGCP